jgi:hypothetical protein
LRQEAKQVKSFCDKSIVSKVLPILHNEEGNLPENWLFFRLAIDSCVRDAKVDGILPTIWLLFRYKWVKLERTSKVLGSWPCKLYDDKFNDIITLAEQKTPCHRSRHGDDRFNGEKLHWLDSDREDSQFQFDPCKES